METGYPFALLEGAQISAVRTAASAVVGAWWLNERRRDAGSISFIGAGVIARTIFDMFISDGWNIGQVSIHDLDDASGAALVAHVGVSSECAARTEPMLAQALAADIVVFATNAGAPYVMPPSKFRAGQIVLNISLRDIAPELILGAENLFDDVDHCMKANTSPHLAEQLCGNRNFVTGTLAQLMRGEVELDRFKPLIFSPFGLGILDLALGKLLFDEALAKGMTVAVPDFFGDLQRW
jgi:ornithine cyclodeaminase/alanine dehydrogenase-like protein (mu-crystallin family)